MKNNSDLWTIIIMVAICAGVVFLIVFGTNSCSASDWNHGICPKCNVAYELKGVSSSLKYYQCPSCHNEVRKY